jgi:hypothetical protein
VLVTAGPTYEDIDPVRYVGNRSSGRMGFAVAAEAVRRGAEVTLVAGPTTVTPPAVGELVRVRSAAEMHEAVMRVAEGMDLVVMSAAWPTTHRPGRGRGKIAKDDAPLTLTLERTRDILADLGALRGSKGASLPVLVGFAAETDDVLRKARDKRSAQARGRHRGQRRVAGRSRIRGRHQRRHRGDRRRRGRGAAAEQGPRGRRHSRQRRARCCAVPRTWMPTPADFRRLPMPQDPLARSPRLLPGARVDGMHPTGCGVPREPPGFKPRRSRKANLQVRCARGSLP